MNNNPRNQMTSFDICRELEKTIVPIREMAQQESRMPDLIVEGFSTTQKASEPQGHTLKDIAHGCITFPRNKSSDEMTLKERNQAIQQHWKDCDQKVIKAFADNSAGGNLESQSAWAKRMGLKSPKNRDMRTNIDWSYWVQREERPSPSEIAWLFGDLYNPDMITDDEKVPSRTITEQDVDVLDMSWPEQRQFRWADPVGYAAWVEALKTEMGVWFDESLVLPDYLYQEVKLERPPLFIEDFTGSFTVIEGIMNVPYKQNAWGVF